VKVTLSWARLFRLLALLLPMVALIIISSSVLDQTVLASRDNTNISTMILGLCFGLFLARSRFHGWFAALYTTLLSTFTALAIASGFFPALSALLRRLPWIIEMHTRLQFFFDQVMSWWLTYSIGNPIRERTILLFLVNLLLWNLFAWLGWWTLRRRKAIIGAVPLGLYLGLIVSRADLSLGYLQTFLTFVLISHVTLEFRSQNLSWSRRGLDYPEWLEPEWGFSAVIIIAIAILAARVVPLLATPEGWRDFQRWIEPEPEIVRAEIEGINPHGGLTTSAPPSTIAMSHIGDPPKTGEAVIMWVEISDPPPLPEGLPEQYEPPQHYWRSHIYTSYNGRGWEPLGQHAQQPVQVADPSITGKYSLRQTYTLDTTDVKALFAVNEPYLIRDASGERFLEGELIPPLLKAGNASYTILSWRNTGSSGQLQSAGSDYPDDLIEVYLQLPEELPDRVTELARRLTHGLTNEFDKAKRIEAYLRSNYPYSLDVPIPPSNRDVVDYFLFEADGGFCSYYASSMAVMLRSIGIPARVVSGYAMGSYDSQRKSYAVLESDSHAWVEAYFPGYGWIEFEPTANRRPFDYDDPTPMSNGFEDYQIEPTRGIWVTPMFISGGIVIAVLIVVAATLLWRRSNQGKQLTNDFGAAGRVYGEMRALLRAAGYHSHAAQTPHEYLNALRGVIAAEMNILGGFYVATEKYAQVRFSEQPISESESSSLLQEWHRKRPRWLIWVVKQIWQNRIDNFSRSRSKR
jgi:hypothetical protein